MLNYLRRLLARLRAALIDDDPGERLPPALPLDPADVPAPASLPRHPTLTGRVLWDLGGGWTVEEALLRCTDGSRALVFALVAPGRRHAWPALFPRLPAWWHCATTQGN